jgi:hypothetical protein
MVDPGRFDPKSFRNKTVAPGIELIMGKLRGKDAMTVQAYRFSAERFTAEQARKWMADRNLRHIAFEAAAKVQAFVALTSRRIQAISADEILTLVPAEKLAEIRRTDPHPLFQAYSVCHEGVSTPRLVGDTAKPITWTRRAVQSIKDTVLRGLKFFHLHNSDNSTEGREDLGEVVWDGQREIGGVLHHVVVGYFPDRDRVKDMDVCSHEGEWDLFESAGQWFADRLHEMTGIALTSSKDDTQAFPGARRLAMVQAFDDSVGLSIDGRETASHKKEKRMGDIDLSTVPFDNLADEIRARKTWPSQIFTADQVQKDREFVKLFDDGTASKKRIEEQDVELKKLREEKALADRALTSVTARDRFSKLVEGMPMTPRQKAFVLKSFPEKVDDASDGALKLFVERKLEDYKQAADVFGVKDELPAQKKTEGGDENPNRAESNPFLKADVET